MTIIPDWEKYAVPQKSPLTGCIPTGFEFLLRAAKVGRIDFSTFQDDFDLDRTLSPGSPSQNNFNSVAGAIRSKYPFVNIQVTSFLLGNGSSKIQSIVRLIESQQIVLISLSNRLFGRTGCHIMPIIGTNDDDLLLLNQTDISGIKYVICVPKVELIRIHDSFPGGDDIAYLQK